MRKLIYSNSQWSNEFWSTLGRISIGSLDVETGCHYNEEYVKMHSQSDTASSLLPVVDPTHVCPLDKSTVWSCKFSTLMHVPTCPSSSIFSMFCWCKANSSNVVIMPSLCSARRRIICSLRDLPCMYTDERVCARVHMQWRGRRTMVDTNVCQINIQIWQMMTGVVKVMHACRWGKLVFTRRSFQAVHNSKTIHSSGAF